jgi:hypothetical protein
VKNHSPAKAIVLFAKEMRAKGEAPGRDSENQAPTGFQNLIKRRSVAEVNSLDREEKDRTEIKRTNLRLGKETEAKVKEGLEKETKVLVTGERDLHFQKGVKVLAKREKDLHFKKGAKILATRRRGLHSEKEMSLAKENSVRETKVRACGNFRATM